MKLAACFTVFDGLELLDKAIKSIMPYCDMVVICYQKVSNTGQVNTKIKYELEHFDRYSDIFLVEYDTDLSVNPKENERRKHNLMVDTARQCKATHFIMMATDHFYKEEDILKCKDDVLKNDWDVTFTKMFTYYKYPTWQITPTETYHMPFICKLYPETRIEKVRRFPVFVDPSVQVNTCKKWHLYPQHECMLHHYSMCRTDIYSKFSNAASSWSKEEIFRLIKEYNRYDLIENPGISYYQGRKVKIVDDYFALKGIFES